MVMWNGCSGWLCGVVLWSSSRRWLYTVLYSELVVEVIAFGGYVLVKRVQVVMHSFNNHLMPSLMPLK